MLFLRHSISQVLIETFSLRRHQNGKAVCLPQRFDGREDRLCFHHHSLPAAKWSVVNDMVFVGGPSAKIMDRVLEDAIFPRPFHSAFSQGRAADFTKTI